MKITLISLFIFLFFTGFTTSAQTPADSVTICGRVTDYSGQPLDSVSVFCHKTSFNVLSEALTDKEGYYKARVKKGRYYAMSAIKMSTYPKFSILAEKDQRLEFWAWNFIADRDTTFNIQYHRMEAYGVHAFQVRGAPPGYTVYVRPMSLTRSLQWRKNKTPDAFWAPSVEKAEVKVTINGEETPIRMIQEVKEYLAPGEYTNAYLLFVDRPKKSNGMPYDIFRVCITDLENGDKGEGVYFKEKVTFE